MPTIMPNFGLRLAASRQIALGRYTAPKTCCDGLWHQEGNGAACKSWICPQGQP